MLRRTLVLREGADVGELLSRLRTDLEAYSSSPDFKSDLKTIEDTATGFVASGTQLAEIGSQFTAKRVVSRPEYAVSIEARYGRKRSLFSRWFGR